MARRKTVSRKSGGKTVIEGGKIVGNLPSGKSTSPVSGPLAPAGKEPAATELPDTSSVSQTHSIFRESWENRRRNARVGEKMSNDIIAEGDTINCYGGKTTRSDFKVISRPRIIGNRWPVQVIDSNGARRTIYMSAGGSVLLVERGDG